MLATSPTFTFLGIAMVGGDAKPRANRKLYSCTFPMLATSPTFTFLGIAMGGGVAKSCTDRKVQLK